MVGRPAAIDLPANGYKLTPNEEETLKAWLLDMDKRGFLSIPVNATFIGESTTLITPRSR
jgi:hypothetical protein